MELPTHWRHPLFPRLSQTDIPKNIATPWNRIRNRSSCTYCSSPYCSSHFSALCREELHPLHWIPIQLAPVDRASEGPAQTSKVAEPTIMDAYDR